MFFYSLNFLHTLSSGFSIALSLLTLTPNRSVALHPFFLFVLFFSFPLLSFSSLPTQSKQPLLRASQRAAEVARSRHVEEKQRRFATISLRRKEGADQFRVMLAEYARSAEVSEETLREWHQQRRQRSSALLVTRALVM